MKVRILYVLIAAFCLSLLSCRDKKAEAQLRNATIDSTIVRMEAAMYQSGMDSVFARHHFNGSIAVFQNGKPVAEKIIGLEDFKAKTRLDTASVFAIGSLSKQFTAVLILQQEEAGKLKTSDKVSAYLSEFQNAPYNGITIHQLLSHTSGLNDFAPGLMFKSGTGFNYSNKGYRFLGEIIEKVSGKTYDENALALFKKVGMQHTFTANIFKGGHFAGASTGLANNPTAVENMPKRLAAPDISEAAGGILSTINDINRWNLALFGGKVLKPNSLQKMLTKSSNRPHYVLGNVGYGYGMMMNLGRPKAYFHTGYVKGSPSLNIFYPDTKTSVVVLSNIANEAVGKEAFFRPHAEMKNLADRVEIAAQEVRAKMLKPIAQ